MSDIDLTQRASFPKWLSMPLRYADLDPLGHVNNVAMSVIFEQARVEFVYPLLQAKGRSYMEIVLARVEIDYLRELSYPGNVEIGTRVERIGAKSVTLVHGVFKGGSDVCAARGRAVLVAFDSRSRTSAPLPADFREALEPLMRSGAPAGS
jgi:acyl-CoA thioester hydrolase